MNKTKALLDNEKLWGIRVPEYRNRIYRTKEKAVKGIFGVDINDEKYETELSMLNKALDEPSDFAYRVIDKYNQVVHVYYAYLPERKPWEII